MADFLTSEVERKIILPPIDKFHKKKEPGAKLVAHLLPDVVPQPGPRRMVP